MISVERVVFHRKRFRWFSIWRWNLLSKTPILAVYCSFAGIYDGHDGGKISQMLAEDLHKKIFKSLAKLRRWLTDACLIHESETHAKQFLSLVFLDRVRLSCIKCVCWYSGHTTPGRWRKYWRSPFYQSTKSFFPLQEEKSGQTEAPHLLCWPLMGVQFSLPVLEIQRDFSVRKCLHANDCSKFPLPKQRYFNTSK